MQICILLPYKENFTKNKAGAVSIFVNDTNQISKLKKNIKVFGSTYNKKTFKNYINITLKKKLFSSTSNQYLNNFIKLIDKNNIDLIEVHNRPHYISTLDKITNVKKILFFHNDPLKMQGSITVQDRLSLINKNEKIVFNSNWSKNQFLVNLPKNVDLSKITVIHQSTSSTKIDFKKKQKIISFVGKLNSSKGYDIFGKSVTKILNKYKDWKCIVIGDEPREKFSFKHKNLYHLGYKNNKFILNTLKKVSISVVPSMWDEPFGRSSLEAASRGCALIISNTGGLTETTNHAIVLKKITEKNLFNKIDFLIKNVSYRIKLQKESYKNFNLTNENASRLIDNLRYDTISKNINIATKNLKNLKILHITNFNERFDGRLHYNTGKRFNNGFIRLGHNVLNISDRDITSYYKSLGDPKGSKTLNNKIINSFKNFNPDIIVMGHADNTSLDTLNYMKEKKKEVKFVQWFLDPVSKTGPDYLNNKKRLLKFSDFMDANFITTDPNSLDFKLKNSFFIPNPADPAFETLENYKKNCQNDVFFAMSHGVHRGILKKGKYDDREKILSKLIKENKNINFDFYGFKEKQPIWSDNFIKKLSNSKMGLNLSRGKPIKYYSSDRMAQLMGNGLLTLIDKKTLYSDFFSKNEIVTYKNYSDLIEKIKKYKKDDNERRRIAKNGKKKYLKYFNSSIVSNFILMKTFNIKTYERFLWD
ncbi:glycosyltransferase [Candidatus Pelagibacter sp.]|uniref:glycosyltransferase n=1 Tax=Candidatus Pelagibacter sp. TaxID=2024849 RepID=UPI003F82B005